MADLSKLKKRRNKNNCGNILLYICDTIYMHEVSVGTSAVKILYEICWHTVKLRQFKYTFLEIVQHETYLSKIKSQLR
jgi:hypothetical protein